MTIDLLLPPQIPAFERWDGDIDLTKLFIFIVGARLQIPIVSKVK
jgi:hypothetical protein